MTPSIKRADLTEGQIVYVGLIFGMDAINKCQLVSSHVEHTHRKNGNWVWLCKVFRDATEQEYYFTVIPESQIDTDSLRYSNVAKRFEVKEQIKRLQSELRDLK